MENWGRLHIYLSTMSVYAGFYCIMGVLSRIKQPMADQFNLSQSFLGILDASVFFGGIIGMTYSFLFPIRKPVRTIIILSCLSLIAMEMQILAKVIPFFAHFILIISRLICGFSMIKLVLITTVLAHYYSSQEDQVVLQFWHSASALGDLIGLLVCDLLIRKVGMNWHYAMTFTMALYGLSVIYLYFTIPEMQVAKRQDNQSCGVLNEAKQFLKKHYSSKVNIIQTLSYALIGANYFLMMFWLPYFFLKIGFSDQASSLSITTPIVSVFGTFFLQLMIKLITSNIAIIFITLNVLNTGICLFLSFMNDTFSSIPIYFMMIFLNALFISGYLSFLSTTDMKIRTNGDHEFMLLNSFSRIFRSLNMVAVLMLAGIWMEVDHHGFFKLNTLISAACAALVMGRYLYYPESFNFRKETEIELREILRSQVFSS